MAGRVGRPAIPGKVHYLRGNPSKLPVDALTDDFQPDVELPTCPGHLQDEARKEYRRIGKELERYGLISKLDRGVLSMACERWAEYVWAQRKMAELNEQDPNGEKGYIDRTPNDYKVMSVYLQIARSSESQYVKLCNELGLTPAARSRVKASSPQLHLPGMGPEDEGGHSLASFAA
jgi:P27 family predicted phage terminase small subunit